MSNVVYFISIDIINIMLLSIRLNLNSPRRVCATLWSGARYFKSNLVKEWPKKENTLEDRVKRVYERSGPGPSLCIVIFIVGRQFQVLNILSNQI